jgi:hypothetical protein
MPIAVWIARTITSLKASVAFSPASGYPAPGDFETMDFVSTAIVVVIVATLMLLGIGMVVNQLLRLRKWLNQSPPDQAPGDPPEQPPE